MKDCYNAGYEFVISSKVEEIISDGQYGIYCTNYKKCLESSNKYIK